MSEITKTVKVLFNQFYDQTEVKKMTKILAVKFEYEDEYKDIAYQLYGYALQGKTIDELIDILENNQVYFDTPCYSDFKERQIQHDLYTAKPFDISEKSIIKCKFCGSYNTISNLKQLRRADEAMTNQILCTDCKKTYCVNGG